jgi:hypothetical protein
MAAIKISEQPAITAAETASGDLFTVVDVSATLNKSITRDNLITAVANNITGLTSALLGTETASGDQFLIYDVSSASMKDITRTELIAAVAANVDALVAATSIKVTSTGTAMTKLLSATATLDFPNILTLASADLTITVTGAAVGDAVHIGLPAAPQAGLVFQGFVSAANTVTIRAHNYTAGALNAASATYRAVVVGF